MKTIDFGKINKSAIKTNTAAQKKHPKQKVNKKTTNVKPKKSTKKITKKSTKKLIKEINDEEMEITE